MPSTKNAQKKSQTSPARNSKQARELSVEELEHVSGGRDSASGMATGKRQAGPTHQN